MPADGSIPGEAPPQIIDIEAVGATANLLENLSSIPKSAASGQAPFSFAKIFEAKSASPLIFLNIFLFHDNAVTDSIGTFLICKKL